VNLKALFYITAYREKARAFLRVCAALIRRLD
jgi:hypothetical protein